MTPLMFIFHPEREFVKKSITEKNIFEAIQFHLEGLIEERLRIPKAQAEGEVLVFTI